MVALLMAVSSLGSVGAAQAAGCQPPDGLRTLYYVTHQASVYTPTNLASDWVTWPRGGSIGYNQTTNATVSASVSGTVSAEAGVIFAKASTTIGTTVGKSWTRQSSWVYTANVPADTHHKYRLHLYHLSYNFTADKQSFFQTTCSYHHAPGYPSNVGHAPVAGNVNTWKLDSAPV